MDFHSVHVSVLFNYLCPLLKMAIAGGKWKSTWWKILKNTRKFNTSGKWKLSFLLYQNFIRILLWIWFYYSSLFDRQFPEKLFLQTMHDKDDLFCEMVIWGKSVWVSYHCKPFNAASTSFTRTSKLWLRWRKLYIKDNRYTKAFHRHFPGEY